MAKIKALGVTLTVGGTAVTGLNSITVPESEAPDIDVTTHDSTAKEFVGGLSDFGTVTLSGKFNAADSGQTYLRTPANQGGDPVPIVITLSDATTITFNAVVKGFGTTVGDVDTAVEFSSSLRISGPVTYTA